MRDLRLLISIIIFWRLRPDHHKELLRQNKIKGFSLRRNDGRFCKINEIDALISKRLYTQNKEKLSQLEIVNKQYCGGGVLSFSLREFHFVLYTSSLWNKVSISLLLQNLPLFCALHSHTTSWNKAQNGAKGNWKSCDHLEERSLFASDWGRVNRNENPSRYFGLKHMKSSFDMFNKLTGINAYLLHNSLNRHGEEWS